MIFACRKYLCRFIVGYEYDGTGFRTKRRRVWKKGENKKYLVAGHISKRNLHVDWRVVLVDRGYVSRAWCVYRTHCIPRHSIQIKWSKARLCAHMRSGGFDDGVKNRHSGLIKIGIKPIFHSVCLEQSSFLFSFLFRGGRGGFNWLTIWQTQICTCLT